MEIFEIVVGAFSILGVIVAIVSYRQSAINKREVKKLEAEITNIKISIHNNQQQGGGNIRAGGYIKAGGSIVAVGQEQEGK